MLVEQRRSRSPPRRSVRIERDRYTDTLLEILAVELSREGDLDPPFGLPPTPDAALTVAEFCERMRECTSFTEDDVRVIFDHLARLQVSVLTSALLQAFGRANGARKTRPVKVTSGVYDSRASQRSGSPPYRGSFLSITEEILTQPCSGGEADCSDILAFDKRSTPKLLPDDGLGNVVVAVALASETASRSLAGSYVDHWQPDICITFSEETAVSVTISCPTLGWEPSQAFCDDSVIKWGRLRGHLKWYASGALTVEWENGAKWLRRRARPS